MRHILRVVSVYLALWFVPLVPARASEETPHGLGKGVFWWEPAVIGPLRSRGFFDDDGNALPVITVFDQYTKRQGEGSKE